MTPSEKLLARASALKNEGESLKFRLSVIEQTVAELEALARDFQVSGSNGSQTKLTVHQAATTSRLSPVAAVRQYLTDHADGAPVGEIADALQNKIETDSAQPRRVIWNTVYNLKKKGQIETVTGGNGKELLKLTDK
jgi:hypothetical protein